MSSEKNFKSGKMFTGDEQAQGLCSLCGSRGFCCRLSDADCFDIKEIEMEKGSKEKLPKILSNQEITKTVSILCPFLFPYISPMQLTAVYRDSNGKPVILLPSVLTTELLSRFLSFQKEKHLSRVLLVSSKAKSPI